jgi:hypothetical protein
MLSLKLTNSEKFLAEIICHRDYLDIPKLTSLFYELGERFCFDLCETNNVTSIAYDTLSFCLEITLPEHWEDSFLALEDRITEYMAELDKIAKLLDDHGIQLIALKNSGIARALYPFLGSSPMGDLDVLVKKSDFRKAHQKLIEHGYTMKFRSPLEEENLDSAEQGGGAEYLVNLSSGHHLWFELQWRPIAGRWIRADQEPSAEDLMSRSISIADTHVRLLSAEDNLLQVALHTAKHTYVRAPGFRLHTDVDRVVRSTKINWDKFLKEVCAIEVKTAVYLSLALAKSLLRTPIPENVLVKLKPGRLKTKILVGWLCRVGLFDPDGKKWGRFGYIIFVCFLYDNASGLLKSIFPSANAIRAHYPNSKKKTLAWLYLIRAIDLIKNRVLVK